MKTMQQIHNGVQFPTPWTQRVMTPRRPARASDIRKASQ